MRWLLVSFVGIAAGCTDSEEAARVELPVTTASGAFAAATTDLGYVVSLSEMQAAVLSVQFTIEGEVHQDLDLPPGTIGHPGHSAGGEVTGELAGDHVLAWNGQPHDPLGTGTLIVGDYHGANFTFRAATAADGVPVLTGHAIHLAGTIAKDGTTTPFDVLIDVEADTTVVGAVFDDVITAASTESLAISFYPTDPYEDDTPFDGIDFFTLPPTTAGVIEIRPGSPEHNLIRRVITTHDHYGVTTI